MISTEAVHDMNGTPRITNIHINYNKLMRKTLLSLLAFFSLSAGAQTSFTSGDFSFSTTSPTTVEVTKYLKNELSAAIPETVDYDGHTYTVTAIGEEAFYWSDLASVTLPATIDSIKRSAFKSTGLISVKLPEGLSYIGPYAFNSSKLTELTLPSTLKKISDHAFFTCYSLAKINFSTGLKEIGQAAFYSNKALTEVNLPAGLEVIDKTVFANCTLLEKVTLPEGLKTIGDGAFLQCKVLQNVDIPSTLTRLGDEAFFKCAAMTKLHLPATLDSLGSGFIGMSGVSELTIDANNLNFHLVDGALYNTDNTILYAIPTKGFKTLNIMSSCIGVSGGACWGSDLETVTFPKGLLAIDDYAFELSQITEAILPNTVTYIGEQAFAGSKLTSFTIPENVLYVLDGTFAQCTELTTVTIPSSVVAIFPHAFAYSPKLQTIIAKGSVAPVIGLYDESYDAPFYEISPSATMTVPKGSLDSYNYQGYPDFMVVLEGATGVLQPVSTSPADSASVSGYTPMSFSVTFAEPVTVVNDSPEVLLKADNQLYNSIFKPSDSWKVNLSSDRKTITVWAADYDGYTETFKFNPEKAYYVILPSDMVKNATGDQNERIVITLQGATLAGIDASPAVGNDVKEVARYNLNGQRIDAPTKGINIVKYSDGSSRKVLVK